MSNYTLPRDQQAAFDQAANEFDEWRRNATSTDRESVARRALADAIFDATSTSVMALANLERGQITPEMEAAAIAFADAVRASEIARLRALGLEACDRLDAVARGARGRDAEEARATADRIRKELTRG